MQQIREQDTDWRKWLLNKPYRPFDPRAYFEFRLYRDFSSGIPDQWMSHGIDMVHHVTGDPFPLSAVAHGGVFAWHDGRENPDTFQALWNIRRASWSAIPPASVTIPTASPASWETRQPW